MGGGVLLGVAGEGSARSIGQQVKVRCEYFRGKGYKA